MRQRYGSPERAKREIFARYASFVYLGNGRSPFRDALFVGSTSGGTGITAAVRIGFDDNRAGAGVPPGDRGRD
jgi:hypothetical protein